MKLLSKRYLRKRRINFLPLAIIMNIIIVFGIIILSQTINDLSAITDIQLWSISEQSTVASEILWQRSVPCLEDGLGHPNGVIALSQDQLILPCERFTTGDIVIAYDLLNGEELWQESARSIDEVRHINDSYIIVFDDSDVKRIDYSGDVIWQYEFTSHSVRTVIPCGDFICIPRSNTGLHYIRSVETGANVQDIEMEYIFALYPDIIVRNQENRVEIVDSATQSVIWSTQVPYQLSYEHFLRYEDMLLIQYANHIRAFNILTGELIWTIENDRERRFRSVPLLLDGHLFIYTSNNALEIFDVVDGNLSGQITLQRMNEDQLSGYVALSGNADTIAIAYFDTQEVIVLRTDFLLWR